MVPLPAAVERRHIEIKAGQFVAQRFTLRRHKEPMEFLFKGLQLFDGLVRGATLTQKVLELVHGMGITGQEVMTLQQFPPMAPISYVTMMSEQSAGDLTSIWL
jgi:hypothetical protein